MRNTQSVQFGLRVLPAVALTIAFAVGLDCCHRAACVSLRAADVGEAITVFRATREPRYLDDARRYARLAESESWMGREQTKHYQFYPFMNLGHFRLHNLAEAELRQELESYYRDGLDRCVRAGSANPYRAGVPFIWCSDNLVAARGEDDRPASRNESRMERRLRTSRSRS